ncbi:MAG: cell division protein ZipA [Gammaproteobacteria bacterium]|nr:cell division protein ZipA [Gammaproteobacteria bacterium]
MDINLMLVLLLLGALVIAFIFWDGTRKKRIKIEKADEFSQDALDEMMDSRDMSGFDMTGVGLSRIIGDEFADLDDPLVATRDDDFLSDETMNASRQDEIEDEPKESAASEVEPELIISLSLISSDEDGFNGEKLLHCMLSRGLRFGDMNIFHRHKNTSGKGSVQFSLANALQPGTFDLDEMSSFQTKAVTLFMMLPGPKEPLKSYQLMLETAQYFAMELNGQLVDSSRSVLTQQTILHFKEQIQDFERRSLSKRNS